MPTSTSFLRRTGWVTITLLATLIALLSARYLTLDPETFLPEQRATYLAHLAPLTLHVGGGVVALVLGPWQFVPRLRIRHPAVHRFVGRVYVLGALATGVGGLLLVPTGLAGPVGPLGFAALAVLLLAATTAGFVTIRRGAVVRHRIWMIRSYALIFTGVTFRLWLSVLSGAGLPFDQVYGSGAWTSWLVNLLVAERLIARIRPPRDGGGTDVTAAGTAPAASG
ncbi:hypothetical protein KNE206_15860 [Kitasatospora sp. NE20-6]|uniref:DUF2306 domain-containing protein n=1 Tax=Kitasatospora sp. NE20-6 TaxID=2859066 RepID=UPI0034DC0822